MQPMWLCIFSWFGDTFENALWRETQCQFYIFIINYDGMERWNAQIQLLPIYELIPSFEQLGKFDCANIISSRKLKENNVTLSKRAKVWTFPVVMFDWHFLPPPTDFMSIWERRKKKILPAGLCEACLQPWLLERSRLPGSLRVFLGREQVPYNKTDFQ